jgi:putative transposase
MDHGTSEVSAEKAVGLERIVRIDEGQIESHVNKVILSTVEDVLNRLMEEEADQLAGAGRYERTDQRRDYRNGHRTRKLLTRVGKVDLKVPRLRKLPLETAIIERYRRRESSVEEALMEMYLAGVSVRRIEDITQALWDTKLSAGTVSELNQELYKRIEAWRNQPIVGAHPYVYLDGIWLKRSWGEEVKNVAVLVAIGVNQDGFREVLGVCEGAREDLESWRNFLRHLKERGLNGVELFVSDKCIGTVEAIGEFYPEAQWQRCVVHFYRNVFTATPRNKRKEVAAMLKAIHAQEDRISAKKKAEEVTQKLDGMRLSGAAEKIRDSIGETLTYYAFPPEHWTRVRTNNMLERLMREIRRRTRVVGCFPDGQSALMLVAGRVRYVSGRDWGKRRYLSMDRIIHCEIQAVAG